MCKSENFAQHLKYFAQLYVRVSVTFINSAVHQYTSTPVCCSSSVDRLENDQREVIMNAFRGTFDLLDADNSGTLDRSAGVQIKQSPDFCRQPDGVRLSFLLLL